LLGGGDAISFIQTSDGGYAIVGGIGLDYLLLKTNSTGGLQWLQTYGSPDKDFAYSVVQTRDGGYAVGGWMWLRSDGGGFNLAIVKTDASGTAQWTKYYGKGMGWTLTATSDGGFAVAGTSLVKVDADGNQEWSLSFQYPNVNETGAVYMNQGYFVTQTRDSGYAVAGTAVVYRGQSLAWLAKVAANPELTAEVPPTPIPSSRPPLTPASPANSASLTVGLSESASALNFGNRVNFTVSIQGGREPYTYAWYVDGQMRETNNSPYYTIDSMAAGSHHVYVEVTDSDNNSATTPTVEFNVLQTPNNSPSTSPSETPQLTQTPIREPSSTPEIQRLNFTLLSFAVFIAITVSAVLSFSIVKYRGRKRG
jgi:hypothetical protein